MAVFWILTPAIKASGQHIGYPWEVAFDSVEDLTIALQNQGIIAGARLDTVDDGRGGKLVRHRVPTALTPKGISAITPYIHRVWEPED